MFENRDAAGRELAARLLQLKIARPVVFALPRGGVPVGAVVASELDCPLDVIVVRKVGHPRQPELALGALVDAVQPIVVRNEDIISMSQVTQAEFDEAVAREKAEAARRKAIFGAGRVPFDPARDSAIIVDDGLATGATARAAIAALRRLKARRILLAVPVAPPESVAALEGEADRVVCPLTPERFYGVSAFYEDFRQVTDEEVVAILAASRAQATKAGTRRPV